MKIFLPFENQGHRFMGVGTFARKFKDGMEKIGHQVFFERPEDYDVLFLIVQAPLKYVRDAKKRKKPIVQRLDGVWYWSVAGWKFPLLNAKAAIIRHFFTDFTVYQSKFSEYSVQRFLGRKSHEQSTIIYNGVDIDLFSPDGERLKNIRDNPNQKIFFTASSFRRLDQIVPILEALKIYKEKYEGNFKLLVAGPFHGTAAGIPKQYADFKNVHFLDKIENRDLPRYERSADIFLFTHFNPPCPNNVIEALSCGLPICGISDGAMPELVNAEENGLLAPAFGNAFWMKRQYDVNAIADNLHKLVSQRDVYSRNARKKAISSFSLERMANEYASVFKSLLK